MLRAYGLSEPDLTDAVRLLRSTFHGFCGLEAIGGFGAPRDVQASWKRALDALHVALEHWPRTEGQENQELTEVLTRPTPAGSSPGCSDAGGAPSCGR